MKRKSIPLDGRRLLAVLGLLLLPARGGAQSLSSLDEYITRALMDWEVPGLSISIVRNDSLIYAKGFGVKEVGKPDRVTERTIFAIGSSTKPFTAALIAQLVDEGKLRWDDRVQRHLSGFQLRDPYVSREVTIRDLLSHQTGLERGDAVHLGTDYDRDEILRRARFLQQEWSFRSGFTYSNIAYLAAGELAAKVAGKSWDDLIQERIFTPLGMDHSNTTIRKNTAFTDIASPHGFGTPPNPLPWRNSDNIGPAGSINSNAVDLARWVRLQLNNGTFEGKELIKPASIREIHSANTVMLSDVRTDSLMPEIHFRAAGLGWFLQDYRGRKIISGPGNAVGMTAVIWLVPEEKFGVVILTNKLGTNLTTALAYRITDLLLGGARRDWSAEYLAFAPPPRTAQAGNPAERNRVPDTKPSLALQKYSGVYEQQLYGQVRVDVHDGKLMIRRGTRIEGPLEHWHFDVFRAMWTDRTQGRPFVTFIIDPQARAQSLRIEGLGEFTRRG